MRKSVFGIALLTTLVGSVAAATQAAAATPVVQPDQQRAGVVLTHDETAALGDGPIPALVTMVVPESRIGAGLKPDTQLYHDQNGNVHASLRQVIEEAASHPDGSVVVMANVPGSHGTRLLDVFQQWH
ncbi:hypothetical protein [Nocardia africana]|uniref:Uncharacterized protein n=1 Tax=Nocardia africana TaxID=134964 RepID=A0A378X634_9NOCA|nr:hypothetical protein [Nocardia africana]MCC3317521.1 hypothetical protein [Nocardia africana]SUA48275.1 Uncharacterised protein [Nocardia africana]